MKLISWKNSNPNIGFSYRHRFRKILLTSTSSLEELHEFCNGFCNYHNNKEGQIKKYPFIVCLKIFDGKINAINESCNMVVNKGTFY